MMPVPWCVFRLLLVYSSITPQMTYSTCYLVPFYYIAASPLRSPVSGPRENLLRSSCVTQPVPGIYLCMTAEHLRRSMIGFTMCMLFAYKPRGTAAESAYDAASECPHIVVCTQSTCCVLSYCVPIYCGVVAYVLVRFFGTPHLMLLQQHKCK